MNGICDAVVLVLLLVLLLLVLVVVLVDITVRWKFGKELADPCPYSVKIMVFALHVELRSKLAMAFHRDRPIRVQKDAGTELEGARSVTSQ
ncbi:hypothetical protein LshimejAT787_2200620 [Lyophyllum shimeji]|uniref:Uncharacterized protein n=1 Tax=Lyophyllum shimeji TaxID=47721 RepID=A0A9P3URR4_LYOSH|nr:hypothetical protein LshimejAT787_2200620 [Lyophyllum shimeji]